MYLVSEHWCGLMVLRNDSINNLKRFSCGLYEYLTIHSQKMLRTIKKRIKTMRNNLPGRI